MGRQRLPAALRAHASCGKHNEIHAVALLLLLFFLHISSVRGLAVALLHFLDGFYNLILHTSDLEIKIMISIVKKTRCFSL
jgi:hypothetical protein